LQYLIHELVSGGSPKQSGGFFTGNDVDIPSGDMRQLENFFNRLAFFPHILDYRGTTPVFKEQFFFQECELFVVDFLPFGYDKFVSVFVTAATLANLTDLGFLWFREFYLETSRVIQVWSRFSEHNWGAGLPADSLFWHVH
jgi:cytoplasmic FMR1 interacting protein